MIRTALKFGDVRASSASPSRCYLAFTIGNLDVRDPLGRNTYALTASFDDVTGLLVNDNVKVAGVVVGKVTCMSTEDGTRRRRRCRSTRTTPTFPKDTSAAVRWRNLIGQRYVYLYPGDSAEALQRRRRHRRHGVGRRPRRAVQPARPDRRRHRPAQVNDFLDTITQALDGREDKVGARPSTTSPRSPPGWPAATTPSNG